MLHGTEVTLAAGCFIDPCLQPVAHRGGEAEAVHDDQICVLNGVDPAGQILRNGPS